MAPRRFVPILDTSVPGQPFLETMRALRAPAIDAAVVVLSVHPDRTVRSLRAAASAYPTKYVSIFELPEAARSRTPLRRAARSA